MNPGANDTLTQRLWINILCIHWNSFCLHLFQDICQLPWRHSINRFKYKCSIWLHLLGNIAYWQFIFEDHLRLHSYFTCRLVLLMSRIPIYKRSKNELVTNSWHSTSKTNRKWKSHVSLSPFSLQWHQQQSHWIWQKLAKNTSKPSVSCKANHSLVLTNIWQLKIFF